MRKKIFIFFLSFILLSGMVFSQKPYKLPPKEVRDIVTAPPPPRISMSPTGDHMLIIESDSIGKSIGCSI